jgi:transglutaminase-like putative cysteine protease
MYGTLGNVAARGTLAPGAQGTKQTLGIMRQLALEGSRMLDVRETAIRILKAAHVAPRDYLGEIRALFQFVRDQVRYTRDVAGVETLQSPRYTLKALVGDCDDKSVLLAALLRSVGHPAELGFRAIAVAPGGPYQHVYVVAGLGGRRIPLDPTNQNGGLGWEFPGQTAALGVAL